MNAMQSNHSNHNVNSDSTYLGSSSGTGSGAGSGSSGFSSSGFSSSGLASQHPGSELSYLNSASGLGQFSSNSAIMMDGQYDNNDEDDDNSAFSNAYEDYYDIDDILAEQMPIPCTFNFSVSGLASLQPGSAAAAAAATTATTSSNSSTYTSSQSSSADGDDGFSRRDENVLPKGTKVELPFWLASNLAFPEYVSVDLPSTYSKKTRNKLNASFISVNFHSLCPYYYRLGVKLADMIDDDDLPNTLTEVFRERAQAVLAKTHTVLEGVANDSAYFVAKLDETEKELFALGVDSMATSKELTKAQARKSKR